MFTMDSKNQEIITRRQAERAKITTPCVGDFIRFETGEVERVSSLYSDALQTSPGGSIYLDESGHGSFSGGLNPAIDLNTITPTTEVMDGKFWIFHHGRAGAGRGVDISIPCRVFKTSAPYKGFLGSSFKGW